MKATRNIVGCKHLSCLNLSKRSRQMNHSLPHRRKCNLQMNFVLFIWLWTFGLTTCLISTGIVLLNETLINSFYMWRRTNPLQCRGESAHLSSPDYQNPMNCNPSILLLHTEHAMFLLYIYRLQMMSQRRWIRVTQRERRVSIQVLESDSSTHFRVHLVTQAAQRPDRTFVLNWWAICFFFFFLCVFFSLFFLKQLLEAVAIGNHVQWGYVCWGMMDE